MLIITSKFLIYPSHDDFQPPIEQSFDFDKDKPLRLWIVPFDISAIFDGKSRFGWPEKCLLKQIKLKGIR